MLKQQQNNAALYLRLSRDDGGDAESNSISTQRIMLRKYAKEQGFSVFDEYVDDGISGTTFERTNFKRMISDIESGKIGIVLCKDLSRLGRNNALVAFYTEIFFVDNDVRFIAINDCIDSALGDNEIMPFKSVINEYYARDQSKKTRSSLRAKAQQGQFLGTYPPLGYTKDPNDKHRLIVDEEGAKLVRRIFDMSVNGMSCGAIAIKLREEGVFTIREYFHSIGIFQPRGFNPKLPPKWQPSSVRHVLQNHAYLGYVVNGRITKKSFKIKTNIVIPEEDWIMVPDCHEALVSKETFELAQRTVKTRQRKIYEHHENIFAGYVKCAECETNLSLANAYMGQDKSYFICNRYRIRGKKDGGKLCTAHYIPYPLLYEAILDEIRFHAAIAKQNEGKLREYAEQVMQSNNDKDTAHFRRELVKLKNRFDELETIISRLFEQNALGVVSDERFISLSAKYETEQSGIKSRIADLQDKIDSSKNKVENMVKLYTTISRFVDVPELDRGILNELIEKVVIHEATNKGTKHRTQKLDIHYRIVGQLPRG